MSTSFAGVGVFTRSFPPATSYRVIESSTSP